MARVLRPRTAPRGHRGWRGSVSRPGGFPVGHHRRRLRVRIPRATRPPSPMKDATPSYDAPFSRWTWRTSWAAPRRSFSASAARWSPSCARVEQPSTQTNPPPTWGCSYPSPALCQGPEARPRAPSRACGRGLLERSLNADTSTRISPWRSGTSVPRGRALRKWRPAVAQARTRTSKHSARDWRVRRCRELARGGDAYRAIRGRIPRARTGARAGGVRGRGEGGGRGGGCGGRRATLAKNVAYLAQHQLFEQLPSLLSDLDPPDVCCTTGGVQRVNAWVGTAGTVTPCHFDSYDNLLGQVAGFKFVRLYAESDSPFLYRSAGALAENRSWPGGEGEGGGGEHVEEESRGAGRARAGAGIGRGGGERTGEHQSGGRGASGHGEVSALREGAAHGRDPRTGRVQHIPARCWHYVRALTTSVSLNFWF